MKINTKLKSLITNILLTNILLTITLSYTLSSCKDESVQPKIDVQGGEILIANEGNFGWGEGTLSLYDANNKAIQNEVYKSKNGESLGNVFNSITAINGQFYFVINNSGKIVVTDSSFKKITEITGLTSPRNMYKVSDSKAYITDLYADAISIVDLKTSKVIGSISCNGHSEDGIITNGKFWFTAPETSSIYAIDINKDQITDSTQVGEMPESIVLDNDKRVWVLCRGKGTGMLVALDPSVSLDLSFTYEIKGAPTNLVYDALLDNFYYINADIWVLDRSVSSTPAVWKAANGKVFYCLKVNQKTSEVYASDVKDFVSKSAIYRYGSDGTLVDEFIAGIISGDFFFP